MKNINPIAAKLVIKRLEAIPPNVKFSIGGQGTFTSEELIDEVQKNTEVGRATVDIHLEFIREMPHLFDQA